MAVPKKRHSKSKVGRRRANQGLKKQSLAPCLSCGAPKRSPHRACATCGTHISHKTRKAASSQSQVPSGGE